MRPVDRMIIGACASFGVLSSGVGSTFAYLERSSLLPAFAYAGKVRYYATSEWVLGVPVEVLIGMLFLSVPWFFLGSIHDSGRDRPNRVFWASTVVVGVTSGLAVGGSGRCVPLWVSCGASLVLMYRTWWIGKSEVGTNMEDGASAPLAQPSTRNAATRVALFGCLFMMVAQFFWLAPRLEPAEQRLRSDAEFRAYFLSLPRVASAEVMPLKDRIKVIVFTDLQCPSCSTLVPQYAAVVAGFRASGRGGVEYETRWFPLESECNPMLRVDVHSAACEAAVAMNILASAGSKTIAEEFERWCASNQSRLSRQNIRAFLEEHGFGADFDRDYSISLARVRADAEAGIRFGVTSTPALFVNGTRLRGVGPTVLESALAIESSVSSK